VHTAVVVSQESLAELWKAAGYVRQLFEANRAVLSSTKQTRRVQGVSRKLREAVRFYDEEYARFVSINEQRRELKAGTKSITAFVTFKTRDAYEDCLEIYRKSKGLDRCRRQAKHLRLQGKNVRVDPAPPPSTIVWYVSACTICLPVLSVCLCISSLH
jgi:RNA recognition motif-containing protein